MIKDLRLAVLILLAGSAGALATNLVRPMSLPWFGREIPPATPTPTDGEKPDHAPHPDTVTLREVVTHFDQGDAFFIDARKPERYAEGHIYGAINLPNSDLIGFIQEVMDLVPPEELVIVYCGGGDCEASHDVKEFLEAYEYTNTKIYTNGWAELEEPANLEHFEKLVVAGEEQ